MANQRPQITAETVKDWLSPIEAVAFLNESYSDEYLAKETLLNRLQGGLVIAVSKHSILHVNGREMRANYWVIRMQDWDHVSATDSFWRTGELTYSKPAYGGIGREAERHYGVRIDPRGVHDITADIQRAATTVQSKDDPAKTTSKGGRPPKEFWDDFWVEMARQIYSGELVPKKQADVENTMHDWLAKHGHDASERTVRNVARKLFGIFKE